MKSAHKVNNGKSRYFEAEVSVGVKENIDGPTGCLPTDPQFRTAPSH